MRYLVRARVRPQRHEALLEAIEQKRLGRGSVAEGEYLRNMKAARIAADGTVQWVEVCYCATPLDEERPYWERYFELTRVRDAHNRSRCRHENGTEPWSCDSCDCSDRLEQKLAQKGEPFLAALRRASPQNASCIFGTPAIPGGRPKIASCIFGTPAIPGGRHR